MSTLPQVQKAIAPTAHMNHQTCMEGRLRSLLFSLKQIPPENSDLIRVRCFKIIYLCRLLRGENPRSTPIFLPSPAMLQTLLDSACFDLNEGEVTHIENLASSYLHGAKKS